MLLSIVNDKTPIMRVSRHYSLNCCRRITSIRLDWLTPLLATSILVNNSTIFSNSVGVFFNEKVKKLTVFMIYVKAQLLRFIYLNIPYDHIH